MSADASTTPPTWRFSWWGRSGYHYLVQVSFDLQTWSYLPATNPSGEGAPITVVVPFDAGSNTSPTKIFFRAVELDAAASPLTGNALPDAWEQFYFGTVEVDQNADPDSDGLTNLQEYRLGTNPRVADTDDDGIPDGWEYTKNLNPKSAADAALDPDKDGLTNHREFLAGADPQSKDSDGDGLTDGLEVSLGSPVADADAAAEIVFIPEFLPVRAGRVQAFANAISNSGIVVGYVEGEPYGGGYAIRWTSTGTEDVGVVSGTNYAYPVAVNDAGVAVGETAWLVDDDYSSKAMYWPIGASPVRFGETLGTIFGYDINDSGMVIGEYFGAPNAQGGAFVRSAGGTLTPLATPSGFDWAAPYGINDENVIVGVAQSGSNNGSRAVRWLGGNASLLPSSTQIAWDVNNAGEIVGLSTDGPFVFRSGALHLLPPLETASQVISDLKINLPGMVIGNGSEGTMIWQPDGQGGWLSPRRLAERLVTDLSPALFHAVNLNDHCELVGDYYASPGPYRAVRFRPVLRPRLIVDANRDGAIKTDASDLTTAATPYRFWINDDDDAVTGSSDSDRVPRESEDWTDYRIECERDLEDFSRIQIQTLGLVAALKSGDLFLGFKWTDVTGNPAIQIFRNLESDGGRGYLNTPNNPNLPQQLVQWAVIDARTASQGPIAGQRVIEGAGVFILPSSLFANLTDAQPTTHLLFEGCKAGKGRLKPVILKKDGLVYTEISEGQGVWLDLKNIKSMYEGPGTAFEQPAGEAPQGIVFVHGWNMSPEASVNFAETMFKRLWHRGFKGRFVTLRWNTNYSDAFDNVPVFGEALEGYLADYNSSERIAWDSGAVVKAAVDGLPVGYSRNIVAHSMGNIVAGSALLAGASFDNYVLMQAAVPASCYDSRALLQQAERPSPQSYLWVLRPTFWEVGASPDDDPVPDTRALSYRGRLSANAGNLVSFYLPDDHATTYAWEFNNDQTKPMDGYGYSRGAPTLLGTQQGLWRRIGGGPSEYRDPLTNPFVAMPMACRSWSKVVGAEGRTAGAIQGSLDLSSEAFSLPGSTGGFRDEHSAQFNRSIQVLRPFYDALLRQLGIEPIP